MLLKYYPIGYLVYESLKNRKANLISKGSTLLKIIYFNTQKTYIRYFNLFNYPYPRLFDILGHFANKKEKKLGTPCKKDNGIHSLIIFSRPTLEALPLFLMDWHHKKRFAFRKTVICRLYFVLLAIYKYYKIVDGKARQYNLHAIPFCVSYFLKRL